MLNNIGEMSNMLLVNRCCRIVVALLFRGFLKMIVTMSDILFSCPSCNPSVCISVHKCIVGVFDYRNGDGDGLNGLRCPCTKPR